MIMFMIAYTGYCFNYYFSRLELVAHSDTTGGAAVASQKPLLTFLSALHQLLRYGKGDFICGATL